MTAPAAGPASRDALTADPAPTRRGRRFPLPPGPAALALAVGALVASGAAFGVPLGNLHNGLIGVTFTGVGVFVLARAPRHRVGRLFVAVGVAHAVMFFGRQYGLAGVGAGGTSLPAAAWAAWLGVWPLPLVLALTGVTFMCFPDGRLPTRRWRAVAVAIGVLGAVLSGAAALWPLAETATSLPVPHPFHLGGDVLARAVWDVTGPTSYLAFQLAWVVCVLTRLHRAEGDEARQLRWFAYAVALGALAMVVGIVVLGSPVLGVLWVPVVPVAAGMAIVKYRLYDIDVVIDKTLVVGTMAAVVTAGYVVVVVVIGELLGRPASSPLLPLVATALVAVAFEPVRRSVQRRADRLVYGPRSTPYEALARVPSELRDDGAPAELFASLAATVAEGVGASEVIVWVGGHDELVAVASWPPSGRAPACREVTALELASTAQAPGAHLRPIVHRGARRGAVTLAKGPGEPLTRSETRLLDDLTALAGLLIDNVGLDAELQARLAQISRQALELQAAAKRIVAAQDEARRRIERDLHDGAQQHLVTLSLELQLVAARAAPVGDPALFAAVEGARRQLAVALAELRDLARGIHPAVLTNDGLVAAVAALAERSPLPVHLTTDLLADPGGEPAGAPDRRLDRDIEAAAYFVVSEALTNATKHADASRVDVCLGLRPDAHHGGGAGPAGRWLCIEVRDDGRGGAERRPGGGLQGLADRLATLGGTLVVGAGNGGRGTLVRAEVPCG